MGNDGLEVAHTLARRCAPGLRLNADFVTNGEEHA